MKRILFITVCALTISANAQDIHFSQFYMSPLNINPASVGAENKVRANMNYREQWKSVASPYKTIGVSYDMRITDKKDQGFLAGGINFYSDRAGDSKMGVAQGNLNLAYHVLIDKGMTIGLGVMGGYAQRSVNTSGLMWGSQYDGMDYNAMLPAGEAAGGNYTKSYFDLGAGLQFTYLKGERYITGNNQLAATAGVAMYHVHAPNYSFFNNADEKLYRKIIVSGNALIGISNSRMSVIPGLFYAIQGPARELVIGSQIRYRLKEDSHFTGFVTGSSLSLGVYYRNKDAVIFPFMFSFGGYSIGFSYDLNVSDLAQASDGRGGFEIALRFIYPNVNTGKGQSTRFL